jgi:uncharacterized protein HemX
MGWRSPRTMADQRPTPPKSEEARPTGPLGGGTLVALGLVVVLVFGIGLGGGLRWRTRRLMLQLQGAVVGLAVGYIAGRTSRPGKP